MALFGKKKDDSQEQVVDDPAQGLDASVSEGSNGQGFSPEKAENFFSHAKTTAESGNHEYSAQLWLRGLRWNPKDIDAVKALWQVIQELASQSKKKSPTKEIAKAASDAKGPVRRYLQELVHAFYRWDDTGAVIKGAEGAIGVDAPEVADLLGTRAFQLARADKKLRKDSFVRLMKVFEFSQNFKLAVECGETARQLDPSDAQLQNDVRNMMAQQTMSRGGFDQAGEEGGFRRNIRDAAKQAQLEAEDKIVKTEDVKDRLVEAAREAYEANPEDLPTIDKYGKALRERGKPADLLNALKLYSVAYKATNQFRFRQAAGELRIRMAKANISRLKEKVEKNPEDVESAEKLKAMQAELDRTVLEELKLQVENYPTDLHLKFKLGVVLFDRGQYDESIAFFQEAQSDPKNRAQVLYYLGRAFSHLDGWESEAIQTLRKAIDELEDDTSNQSLELRYDLMCALQRKAQNDRDRAAAQEADELAAAIAMQRFGFRDIREKRDEIKSLLRELKD